jgi:acetylornithine deacetylase
MRAAAVREAVEASLRRAAAGNARLTGVQYRVSYAGFQAEGFVAQRGAPIMQALASAHERVIGAAPQWYASTATTDARTFALYGSIPATCYGPEATNIHGIDESVSLSSTVATTQVLALLIARWCGLEKAAA